MNCSGCNKRIYFWQKKTDYLTYFNAETDEKRTEPMHRYCGLMRAGNECFGDYHKAPGWRYIRK